MAIKDVTGSVLVTGGGGFVGSRLVHALLAKGKKVKVLEVRRGLLAQVNNPRLKLIGLGSGGRHRGMADAKVVAEAVEDVELVYHLAIDWDGHSWRHSLPLASLFEANIRGTLNLLEASRNSGVWQFVFASSCAVYGLSTLPFVDEETTCRPETWDGDPGRAYGIVKYATERLCMLYHYQHGLPVSIFRIDFVYDEMQALPTGAIEDNLRTGKSIDVIEGDGYAAIHVDDVIEAFLLAALNETTYGRVFNLADPDSFVSYHELYELLIRSTGSKSRIRLRNDPNHPHRALESTEKIRRLLGWKPRKTRDDLLKAIARSVGSTV